MRWVIAAAALVLFPWMAPLGAAQATPEPAWSVEDPAGDQSPVSPGTLPVPSNPVSAHGDLRGVTIDGENELGLYFNILLEQLAVDPDASIGFEETRYLLTFALDGTDVEYEVRVHVFGSHTNTDAASLFLAADLFAYMCVRTAEEFCRFQDVQATLLDDANAIRLWVSKAALMGQQAGGDVVRGGPGGATPLNVPPIKAGTVLSDIRAESRFEVPVPCFFIVCVPASIELYDVAPDGESPPFAFASGAANTVVSLQLSHGEAELSVQGGQNQSVPLTITNHAAGKRILQLSYALEGPQDKLANYGATGPPSVAVPGGETRNFTLGLNVLAGASSADGVHLVVRGASLAFAEEVAYAEAALVPGIALGPGANTLYLHATQAGFFGEPFDPVACLTAVLPCEVGYLSADASAPDSNPDGRIEGFGFPDGPDSVNQFFFLDLDQALPAPIAFDMAQPITFELTMRAPIDAEGVLIEATLAHPEGILFESQARGTVTKDGTTFQLSGSVHIPDQNWLPAGIPLHLRVETQAVLSPTATVAFAAGGFEILGPRSQIRLPLVELPPELRPTAPSTVQLSPLGDTEEFVNPGEARLFNVSVLNQALETVRADLAATVQPSTWTTEILLGNAFQLAPGDSVTVGVLVRAPADAAEGETATVWLNATASVGGPTSLKLVTIATSGVDLPDDSGAFRADADDEAKRADQPAGGSPGFEALLVVLALLGLVAWRRRVA